MKTIIKYNLASAFTLALVSALAFSSFTIPTAKADVVISIQPGISILGQVVGASVGSTTVTVAQGDKFSVTGMPMGLTGLKYGTDYTVALSIDPLFTGCYTTAISSNVSWSLVCHASTPGTGNILFRIYMKGKVYISNIVTVTVKNSGTVIGSAAPISIAINAATATSSLVATASPSIVSTPVPTAQKVGFFHSLFASIYHFFAHIF